MNMNENYVDNYEYEWKLWISMAMKIMLKIVFPRIF